MDKKLKTLLILSPAFPKDENDTSWIPPQQVFVKALKATHPNLNIVLLTFQYPFLTGQYNWHGVAIIAFGGRGRGKLYRIKTWIKVWLKLLKLHRRYQVIGLLSFWLNECALLADSFARIKKLPHYCWLLGQDAKAGNNYTRYVMPPAAGLVALSDFIAREFNRNYKVKPRHIIPVGIDEALFTPWPAMRDIDIIGAGSLIPLKQYHLFVEIISLLKHFYPDIKAMICGVGPQRDDLQSQIGRLNLEDNILLTGELPHREVLALMQRSKVLLHPSAYEGFGAVCLEALYAGARVISFVKPMDKAIKNWHIVTGKNDMVQTLIHILNDPDPQYESVMPFNINDNAVKMMKLFAYKDDAIS